MFDKDVLFVSCLIPKQLEDKVRTKSKSNMQDAANALQWNIFEGLSENIGKPITSVNTLPIGSFPQYYKDAFVKRCEYSVGNSKIFNCGFCNIKLLRKFLLNKSIYKEIKHYYKNNVSAEKCLFVYTLNSQYLKAIKKAKKKETKLRVFAIVADLPNMSTLSSKKSVLQKLFGLYLSKKSYSYLDCIDGYILLTRQMADYMNINKPFVVMEGIASKTETNEIDYDINKKTILYTGTLHRKFGILNLLDAFGKINDPDYRLIICGVGDSEKEIKAFAEKDNRIDFKGQLTREEVLILQKQATVLVNPRQNNEEFTKYSFPSKTMEYLASGVPVVAYKLDGIPDEYDEYIRYVPDNSPETLAKVLMEVCELSGEERQGLGEKARKFVLVEKNKVAQTKRILDFIENNWF